ncbi:hypothetical protein, partial [Gemmiger sp.]|uniref:hypothetical protein n=1 Tax=Gemmiger sp. TaxID=2049027 RepID=UPI003AB2FC8D
AIMPQIRPWATALGIELIREAKNPMNKTSELFWNHAGEMMHQNSGERAVSTLSSLFIRACDSGFFSRQ